MIRPLALLLLTAALLSCNHPSAATPPTPTPTAIPTPPVAPTQTTLNLTPLTFTVPQQSGAAASNHPTGKILYAASPRTLAFDVQTGNPLPPFAGKFSAAGTPIFSQDASRAAVPPENPHIAGTLSVFDTATGKNLFTTPTISAGQMGPCALSPDGKTLAVTTWVLSRSSFSDLSRFNHAIFLYDVDSASLTSLIHLGGHNHQISAITFSPDGKTFATASGDAIRLFNLHSQNPSKTFPPAGDYLAFSHDSRYLACATTYYGCMIWDTTTGNTLTDTIPLAAPIAFSPTSLTLAGPARTAAPINNPDSLVLYNLTSKSTQIIPLPKPARISSVVFSPDATHLALTDFDSQILQYTLPK